MKQKSLLRSSISLFATPVSYEDIVPRKTFIVNVKRDDLGNSVSERVCVEDKLKDIIQLNFEDATLSNLIDKGVSPKALDILDTQRLGIDEGIDRLADSLIADTDKYVITSKS